jgi:monoamine oxidase
MPLLDHSLCEVLVDNLGLWWQEPMHRYEAGMEALPNAFVNYGDLKNDIYYGVKVNKIDYSRPTVEVQGTTITGERIYKADYVIITVPLNIISNLIFNPTLSHKKQDALTKVNYAPSTKVTLLFREKFWLDDYKLRGGFTKSTSLIGQIHYPTMDEHSNSKERGVLLCYTWNHEALVWQSMSEEEAVYKVAQEIARIHSTKLGTNEIDNEKRKRILDLLETGKVQAWYTDPNTQGAFVLYLAYSSAYLMDLAEPIGPVFFAGEGISFTHGWIQGALESGLAASYCLAMSNQTKKDEI